jgi:hypothetical protein
MSKILRNGQVWPRLLPGHSTGTLLAVSFLLLFWLTLFSGPAAFANPASAFSIGRPPLKITVLVGPRNDFCYSDHIDAIEKLARAERDRINNAGGISGRPVEVQFRDDAGDARRTVANVSDALTDPNTIALIGLQSSNRAGHIFKQLGPRLAESGIPWISSISVTHLFAGYPNVFTMQGSQEEESIPVIAQFLKEKGFARPAFIGFKGSTYAEAIINGLEASRDFPGFAAKRLLVLPGADAKARMHATIDPAEVANAVDELKWKNPDIIFLSVGGWRVPAFLKELEQAGMSVPVFVSGRLEDVFRSPSVSYGGDAYQIARDELPNLYNNRLRTRLFRERSEEWVFNGDRNQDAFDRLENGCEERPANAHLELLSRSNLRAIGMGVEFRDMIAMAANLANAQKPAVSADDIGAIRRAIVNGIPKYYAAGRGVFKGGLEDWSFRPDSRTAVRAPFILTRPKGLNKQQLAPLQYVPLQGERFRKIPTIYLDVDLTHLYRVDDVEKTFSADFYLSMSDDNNPGIDQIEFANAVLDYKTGTRQITVQPLHEGGESDTYPSHMKIYQVSGKFLLDPVYKSYPFDAQRFSIDLRPKKGEFPFIVQPMQKDLRDKAFDIEGWDTKDAYVTYDQDSVSVFDAKKLEPNTVPFYKNSFVWVAKRSATDFYLRVVVPLIFIAAVAYFAVFIPSVHFEAIVTIQVTALLSAVALYITTPKVDSDTSTLSDKIFLFNYMIFTFMIAIAILRINKFAVEKMHIKRLLGILHIAGIPLMLVLMFFYVWGAGAAVNHSELEFWPAMREGAARFFGGLWT